MEAANRGAHESGCQSIGLNIVLPFEQSPNIFITPELSFQFHYFAIRKMHFLIWSGHDPIRANLGSREAFRARCSGNCGEGKKNVAEYGFKIQ
jgi:hypothetical protein